ncbi:MAG: hypothetical protein IAA97_03335 [Spirochaetes bacterium]|uniref:Uncharacterized protein n=1 Tax=Candidatus Ornithospirochaeta stercoripullorum TaxID=2840899 RepID=A0A9D9DYS3_9SPIO|nr:hypothetical protein [Candidatus Ornithospirochaeta stercoripullorum]
MKRAVLILLASVIFLVSCVYTERFDTERGRYLGESGDVLITVDVDALKKSGESALLAQNELVDRVDRVSLALSSEDDRVSVSGIANGLLSSTEVGTALIWDPSFIRASDVPKFYENKRNSLKAGVVEDGIMLFTTGDYEAEYGKLKKRESAYVPEMIWNAMSSSLAALYVESPESISIPELDIPEETISKIEEAVLMLNDTGSALSLSGTVLMDDESSARTLCTLLRNLMVQRIRREGGKLDIRALSGIFTYEDSEVRISGYTLSYDEVGSMLTKEF